MTVSTWSSSRRLAPTSWPWALRNVKSIPPPMSSESTRGSRCPMTPSLSDTLDPPSTTVYGRSGFSVRRSRTSSSLAMSEPAALGSADASSNTLACLRCTTPKPSDTNASPSSASDSAKPRRTVSSLLVSSAWKRRFSSTTTSPSPSASTAARAESPTVSLAKATSAPSSSPRRAATGRRLYLSSGVPSGRPRCEITTTRAPASRRPVRVPSEARMRPSSPMTPSFRGTLRSQRTMTRRPRRSPRESMVRSATAGYRRSATYSVRSTRRLE